MLTHGEYIYYCTLNSKQAVEEWLDEGTPLLSNHKNYRKEAQQLLEWKEAHKRNYKERDGKRAYNNVFAHQFSFLIPYGLEKDKWEDFIKSFVERVSDKFIDKKRKSGLLWIAKQSTINKANYVQIIMFARKSLQKERKSFKKYKRDFYYLNGKLVSSDTEGAVLMGKKGDYVLDKNGQKIEIIETCESVEEDNSIFRYKNFSKWINSIKKKWKHLAEEFTDNCYYFKISKHTVKSEDLTESRNYSLVLLKANKEIEKLNNYLQELQETLVFLDCKDYTKGFRQVLDIVDSMVHKEYAKFEKVKELIQTWWTREIGEDWINA